MFDTRLTLAWENAPLSYAAAPALLLDFDLVPELLVGAFVRDDRAEGYFGAGVRAELKAANNRNRILNTRGSVYLAARGLVVGDPQLAMVELAFGQFYMIGAQARFGFELAMQVARTDTMDETGTELAFMSGVFAIYVGWMR